MIIREGRLIIAPKLIIGAVFVVPTIKFKNGININAPPPPLIVEIEKEINPAKNIITRYKKSMFSKMSNISKIKEAVYKVRSMSV